MMEKNSNEYHKTVKLFQLKETENTNEKNIT